MMSLCVPDKRRMLCPETFVLSRCPLLTLVIPTYVEFYHIVNLII